MKKISIFCTAIILFFLSAFFILKHRGDIYGIVISNMTNTHGKLNSDKNKLVMGLFEFWPQFMHDAEKSDRIFLELLSDRYKNVTLDDSTEPVFDIAMYDNIVKKPKEGISIYFTGEPSILPNINHYDLALGFDYVDHPKYLRFPLYYLYYSNKISTKYNRGKCEPQKKKYFACFLVRSGNRWRDGCNARDEMFAKLSKYKFVASGGSHLNNLDYKVGHDTKSTLEWLNQCKFVIAYENTTNDGYTTEKPFQAYFGGSIPLYYGNKLYYKDLNPKAVIHEGSFKSQEEEIEYIKKLDQDDDLYCQTWNQPIITEESQSYEFAVKRLKQKYEELIFPKIDKLGKLRK